ncbi:ATP phosphoribosyltransferase regulatory subunit [Natranaerovirga hydrolytica]|uniref:ATP phosphoribosyltransferase regulatory subunit n=1 Tax=Natranaerovirga hydrolytica TaxID=680378 RepID=A0A4R1MYA8_9FIRM|nr:ATP phosphoribosyltransferase regulatory subunit [Natranaerovirga hydrolytica]TCK98267.1 ATP phosphoribosyltransferase regulatory subunit [Natranaerovirga hydrolytica]
MLDKILHTPEGVRDIYNQECLKKITLQERIENVLHRFGYQDIQTPTFEYYEVFNHERGTVDTKEMYKFFDRDSNILVLRPDITPSIGRSVAKYYKNVELPLRFCYTGNTFRNNASLQGKLKEVTQQGAELIGDDSPQADAEMIVFAIECFLESGLKEFQMDIGQVEFFKGIIEEAGLDAKTEEQLKTLIDNKNFFGVEDLLSQKDMSDQLKDMFLQIPNLFGSVEVLEKAKKITTNKRAIKALERLEKVYEILCYYGVEDYVSFDLGMINQLNYYTGIIFRGYTYGTGVSVVDGGRYDSLLSQFGKDAPAIGFAILIDELMLALNRQNIEIKTDYTNTLILYKEAITQKAIELTQQLRGQGLKIELQLLKKSSTLEEYIEYGYEKHIGGIIFIDENEKVKIVDLKNKDTKEAHLSDLYGKEQ